MRIYNVDYGHYVENLKISLVTSCLQHPLKVDDDKWRVPRNRAPPPRNRAPAALKQAVLYSTLETMLKQGIIVESQASHYSQVLLVVAPRTLVGLPNASWPIPNIAEMLRRISSRKPKIFGSIDLTQEYHQAPLSDTTRKYTAFITFSGVYEVTRLPFGPKRSPFYFHEIVATTVLVGLIYMT